MGDKLKDWNSKKQIRRLSENDINDLLDSLYECICENSINTFMEYVKDIGDIEFEEFEAEDLLRYSVPIELDFNGLCMKIFHQTIIGG